MILLGINDLARREQARELLAWGAERYWGAVSLAADRGRGAGEALVSRLSPALL